MRYGKWVFIVVVSAIAAMIAQAQPTTRPAESGMVRGHVSIKGGGLFQQPDTSRVVIYVIASDNFDKQFGPTGTAFVAQKNKTFIPNFVVVPRGTNIEFPNWDHLDHNVFSRSAAAPAFDLDKYPFGKSKSRMFEKLGVVQVFCNVHPDMRAVIYVTPNRFFTRADKQGNFQIQGLPFGHYQIAAWQDRCDEQRQEADVKPDQPAEVTFTLKESRERVLEATDNRQDSYGVERGLGVKRERLDLPVVTDVHDAPAGSEP